MKGLTTKQTLQLLRIAENTQQGIGLDELAFITLMRICRDYASPEIYPHIRGEERNTWLEKRLGKFRIRFFGKI